MKNFSLLIAGILFATVLNAQMYARVGYCANYYSLKNYNAMIERYNVTRSWLTDKMEPIHLMHGIDVGIGAIGYYSGIEFYFRSAKAVVTASGSPNVGPEQTRYVKARDNHYGIEMHRRIGSSPLTFFIGGELSGFRTFTKVDDAEYALTDKKVSFGLNGGAKIILGHGNLRPMLEIYYNLPFIKESHENAWAILDQSNYASEPAENFRARASHFGVSLSLAFGKIADP